MAHHLPATQPRVAFRAAARLQWLAVLPLAVCLAILPRVGLLPWLTIGLSGLTLLKLLEARRLEERRLVALLQLLLTGVIAAQLQSLAPSLLQLAAAFLALAGLLALELGAGLSWLVLLRRSLQVLLAGLPLAMVLFLLVPRFEPFVDLPRVVGASAVVGLSDQLDPGSIASLAAVDAPAARVRFQDGPPPPPEQRYWRVLVHERFDGHSWQRASVDADASVPSPASAESSAQPAQLWVASPSRQDAVPWSGQGLPLGEDLQLSPNGELLHRGSRDQRRVYAVARSAQAPAWQSTPPTAEDLELPRGSNPKMESLGASWRSLPAPEQRLAAAQDWYERQGFSYTLQPGVLPENAPLDAFLFERRRGFCGHYASSFTALMRMAGLPARVVSGYRGGRWVDAVGGQGYLDLRQSDAHAWSEVWLPQQGWVSVDPSRWVKNEAAAAAQRRQRANGLSVWLQQQWWALDLGWSSLWIGFDRSSQTRLLQWLLGPYLPWLGLIVLVALTLALALGLGWLQMLQSRSTVDPTRRQLDLLLDQLAGRGFLPRPGETLARFAQRLQQQWPELGPEFQGLVHRYQQLRFSPGGLNRQERRRLADQSRALGRRIRRLPH